MRESDQERARERERERDSVAYNFILYSRCEIGIDVNYMKLFISEFFSHFFSSLLVTVIILSVFRFFVFFSCLALLLRVNPLQGFGEFLSITMLCLEIEILEHTFGCCSYCQFTWVAFMAFCWQLIFITPTPFLHTHTHTHTLDCQFILCIWFP